MPRGRAALLYLALLAGLAWAPSRAGAQWGFPVAVPQVAVPGVWDWTQAVDWYWDSLLGGLETWRPEAAHGPSHEERRPVGIPTLWCFRPFRKPISYGVYFFGAAR